jgi:hypothetical protein
MLGFFVVWKGRCGQMTASLNVKKAAFRDCYHPHTHEEEAPAPHYKQLICDDCATMIRFLPHPATQARAMRNGIMIEKLLSIETQLEAWELSFVHKLAELSNVKKLMHRQSDLLQEMHKKYFPADTQEQEVK